MKFEQNVYVQPYTLNSLVAGKGILSLSQDNVLTLVLEKDGQVLISKPLSQIKSIWTANAKGDRRLVIESGEAAHTVVFKEAGKNAVWPGFNKKKVAEFLGIINGLGFVTPEPKKLVAVKWLVYVMALVLVAAFGLIVWKVVL